jgi:hypothetical protein
MTAAQAKAAGRKAFADNPCPPDGVLVYRNAYAAAGRAKLCPVRHPGAHSAFVEAFLAACRESRTQ